MVNEKPQTIPKIGTIEYCMEANRTVQLQEYYKIMKQIIPSLAKINGSYLQETINLAEGKMIDKSYGLAIDICYNKDCISFGIDPENPEKFEKAAQLYFLFALKREKLLARFSGLEMHVIE
ncbi:hypothetical protein J4465_01660 [Candidatus Pacearchaeota archaeon]|nr:hypothetical protein [Candidatus Pacearchaeota archaeon]